jgi:hypothetical protein
LPRRADRSFPEVAGVEEVVVVLVDVAEDVAGATEVVTVALVVVAGLEEVTEAVEVVAAALVLVWG